MTESRYRPEGLEVCSPVCFISFPSFRPLSLCRRENISVTVITMFGLWGVQDCCRVVDHKGLQVGVLHSAPRGLAWVSQNSPTQYTIVSGMAGTTPAH